VEPSARAASLVAVLIFPFAELARTPGPALCAIPNIAVDNRDLA
jgi:hypothetical protein